MLYPLKSGQWLCGFAQTMGEDISLRECDPRCVLTTGNELFDYLINDWEKHSGEVLSQRDWEVICQKLRRIDHRLSAEFAQAIALRPIVPRVIYAAKPKRVRYKARVDTIEGIEERLSDVQYWTRGVKKALRILHERARLEQAQRRNKKSTRGPYERLEMELFGDPNSFMSTHEDQGLGFDASLIDGPSVDFFNLAGIDSSDGIHDAVWKDNNWQSILDQCEEAFCVEIGDEDYRSGASDTFYWVCVTNPEQLARQLREFIVSKA
jgi:hypothetical protein